MMRARRCRTFGIRSPRRRHGAHTAAAQNPSAMIPVPILITGNPHALPPAIAIFRDHHRVNNYRCWRRRRLNYYSRGRGYNISLLRREKYVIKVAEKSVYPTGIFPVINMSPRDMSVITGTSGKKASCQCYRQKFHFIFYKLLLAGFSETLSVTNRQQRSHPAAGLLYPLLRFLAVDEADQCAETRHQIRQIPHCAKN